jgi:hypothetical protein
VRRHGGRQASQASGPANLDKALAASCDGVAGFTPAQFRALLSPEDIDDIAAGAEVDELAARTKRGLVGLATVVAGRAEIATPIRLTMSTAWATIPSW